MRKKTLLFMMSCLIYLVAGCSQERFEPVNPHQPFVASVNILQPSVTFYGQSGDLLAAWSFEKGYTGAILIGFDQLLVYGYQLKEIDMIQLSSGKKITSFQTESGITNAYFDPHSDRIFLTNGKTNELLSYTAEGQFINKVKLRNYPMAMISSGDRLYVANYKDTLLSVVHTETLEVLEEWEIPSSSQGLYIAEERRELWLGGHGKGNKPNKFVHIYHMDTGQRINELSVPLMPVAFTPIREGVAIASHGSNTVYQVRLDGEVVSEQDVSANPFAVAYFQDQIVVAGYDDHTLYFIDNGEIKRQVPTNKGPFQLLVREGE